jgi:hypothetical protein
MLWNSFNTEPNVVWDDYLVIELIKLPFTETKLDWPINNLSGYNHHVSSMFLCKDDDKRMRIGVVGI